LQESVQIKRANKAGTIVYIGYQTVLFQVKIGGQLFRCIRKYKEYLHLSKTQNGSARTRRENLVTPPHTNSHKSLKSFLSKCL